MSIGHREIYKRGLELRPFDKNAFEMLSAPLGVIQKFGQTQLTNGGQSYSDVLVHVISKI